jgi:hypothetical protein
MGIVARVFENELSSALLQIGLSMRGYYLIAFLRLHYRVGCCDGTATRIVERLWQCPRPGGAARAGQPGDMGAEVVGARD